MLSYSRPLALIGIPALALSFFVACTATVSNPGFIGGDDAGTGTSKDPTTGTGGGLCATACQKSASQNCSGQSTCEADCKRGIDSSPAGCKEAIEKLIECSGSPAATYEGCSSAGKPKMKGCDDETMAYLQCVQSGGKPDGGGTTTTPKCDQLETGVAACDTCMDAKCCAQETACVDEPDCLAFYDCLSAGTPQATCQSQHPTGFPVALKQNQCMQASCATPCQ